MSRFLNKLELEYIDGHNWRVTRNFAYESSSLKRTITVPAGFVTDFASIPRFLWSILPPTGGYGEAACIHDECYRTPHLGITRAQADKVLLEAMEVLGVGRMTRWTIYAGVRVGGAKFYKGGA